MVGGGREGCLPRGAGLSRWGRGRVGLRAGSPAGEAPRGEMTSCLQRDVHLEGVCVDAVPCAQVTWERPTRIPHVFVV